jgi:hypothetical protein
LSLLEVLDPANALQEHDSWKKAACLTGCGGSRFHYLFRKFVSRVTFPEEIGKEASI